MPTKTCPTCGSALEPDRYDHAMLWMLRAFRLGQEHEHASVMAQMTGGPNPPSLGAEKLRKAVSEALS